MAFAFLIISLLLSCYAAVLLAVNAQSSAVLPQFAPQFFSQADAQWRADAYDLVISQADKTVVVAGPINAGDQTWVKPFEGCPEFKTLDIPAYTGLTPYGIYLAKLNKATGQCLWFKLILMEPANVDDMVDLNLQEEGKSLDVDQRNGDIVLTGFLGTDSADPNFRGKFRLGGKCQTATIPYASYRLPWVARFDGKGDCQWVKFIPAASGAVTGSSFDVTTRSLYTVSVVNFYDPDNAFPQGFDFGGSCGKYLPSATNMAQVVLIKSRASDGSCLKFTFLSSVITGSIFPFGLYVHPSSDSIYISGRTLENTQLQFGVESTSAAACKVSLLDAKGKAFFARVQLSDMSCQWAKETQGGYEANTKGIAVDLEGNPHFSGKYQTYSTQTKFGDACGDVPNWNGVFVAKRSRTDGRCLNLVNIPVATSAARITNLQMDPANGLIGLTFDFFMTLNLAAFGCPKTQLVEQQAERGQLYTDGAVLVFTSNFSRCLVSERIGGNLDDMIYGLALDSDTQQFWLAGMFQRSENATFMTETVRLAESGYSGSFVLRSGFTCPDSRYAMDVDGSCSADACYGVNKAAPGVCSGHGTCDFINSCSCRMNDTNVKGDELVYSGAACEVVRIIERPVVGASPLPPLASNPKASPHAPVVNSVGPTQTFSLSFVALLCLIVLVLHL